MSRSYKLPVKKIVFLFAGLLLPACSCLAQYYTRIDSIPVKQNGNWLKNPWAGGHNFCQFSDIDLNSDGIKDLFVFDRTGNKITTYINAGTPNTVSYTHAPQYEKMFPSLQCWVLLTDYNCDGKEDIFTSAVASAGISVYKNTSSSGNLQFTLVKNVLKEAVNNIPANPIGLPVVEDIDNDGDLDILTYSSGSWLMSYYINKSKEMGYACDSLLYNLSPGCWGHFTETQSNCAAALTSCRTIHADSTYNNEYATGSNPFTLTPDSSDGNLRNGSSCSLCLDMDGDGDKELVLGQGNCCTVTLLTNGGTASSANMTSLTSNFPSGTPINIRSNPCAYFLDANNDLKRDLLVSPSQPNSSVNNESIWYYQNTGTDQVPVFSRVKRNFLQDEMIDVGAASNPVFFDFNNDGLADILISNFVYSFDSCTAAYGYGVYAYQNIGTSTRPKFELISTDYADLSTALPFTTNKHLTFGDLDGDGDMDMFVGDYNGMIHYFQNSGGTGPAVFTLTAKNYADSSGNPIDVGSYSAPQLVDADRDTDLDLIIGEQAGNLNYYQNTGTTNAPSFIFRSNSFGGVDVLQQLSTGYSIPFLHDSAGSYRLFVGSESSKSPNTTPNQTGWIWYYKNIDGNLSGNFTLVDSMYHRIWEGTRMTVNGKDITGDGKMDLLIGNDAGGIAIYAGDSIAVSVPEINTYSIDFTLYPNPGNGSFNIACSLRDFNSLKIYDVAGKTVYQSALMATQTNFRLNVPNGVYFCELRGEYFSKTKKLVVLK